MQQIIYFIKKFKYFLLFILLEILALFFTIQQHSYHQSKFINSANSISGSLYNYKHSINEFFYLKTENKLLIEENVRLKNTLEHVQKTSATELNAFTDKASYEVKYEYSVAKIINNNYTNRNNVLTLDKGSAQ